MTTTMTGAPAHTNRIKTSLPPEFLADGQPGGAADEPLATFLGLFSVGLGLWEVLAPDDVAERTGVRFPAVLRAYGLREIGAGLGILSSRRPAGWLWSRVAGDVLDLATIAAAYARAAGDADRRKTLLAAAAVAGVTALDVAAARAHSRS